MKDHCTKLATLAAAAFVAACAISSSVADDDLEPRLKFRDRENKADGTTVRSGSFRVYENRAAASRDREGAVASDT